MDSGNSGSLQSSSGGDEEYDSRAAVSDSVSAFMSGTGGGPISNQPPPFFDPLSNYLQLHQNSSLLDPNPAWPRQPAPMRSDPNPVAHNPNLFPSSAAFMPSFQQAAASAADASGPNPQPQNQNPAAARNLKKRSRASRRAPTTVLTTDTNNFRAMVQEFTGIPAPPFNSSSPFPRSRLDLFGSRSAAAAFESPPYLRRPFAQKPQPPPPLPFLPSTSAAAGAISSATNNNNLTPAISSSNNTIAPSSSSNPLFAQTNPPNLFQNPALLTSLLQTTPKFPFSNDNSSSNNPHVAKMVNLDEQFHFIHSDQISLHNNDVHNNNTGKDHKPDDDEDGDVNLRTASFSGDYNFSSSKMMSSSNLAAAASFHHGGGKRAEQSVPGEGMVESWICSSE